MSFNPSAKLDSVHHFLLLLFAFALPFMPFQVQVSAILLILLVLVSALNFRKTSWNRDIGRISIIVLFLLWPIGVLWADNYDMAWRAVTLALPLLLFPFVLSARSKKTTATLVLRWFVVGCVVACAVDLIAATYRYGLTGDWSHFSYHKLSLFHHPSYFAMYLNVALFYSLSKWANDKLFTLGKLTALLFVLMIILMFSRNGIIVMGLILIWFIGRWLVLANYRNALVLSISLALFVSIGALNPRIQNRFDKLVGASSLNERTESRMAIWKASMSSIMDRPLLGVGTGNSRLVLKEKLSGDPSRRYNTHNQFLETSINHGIVGVLVLLFLFAHSAWRALSRRDDLVLAFLAITALSFLTESMLERQAGMYFFAFFYSFLCIQND